MADMPANVGITRKMSFGINGKLNGVESKTPFLIGVSGGTASGKVYLCLYLRRIITFESQEKNTYVHILKKNCSGVKRSKIFYVLKDIVGI